MPGLRRPGLARPRRPTVRGMNVKKFDPYEELDVPRDATEKEVRAAYRRRAKATHPDKGGDPDAFQSANRALTLLVDPARRERFDRTGDAEEEKPDVARSAALGLLDRFFNEAINAFVNAPSAENDPRRRDILGEFRAKMGQEIDAMEGQRASGDHVKALLRDLRDRLGCAAGEDVLGRIVDRRLENVVATQKTLELEVAARRVALGLVADRRFRFDQPAPIMVGMTMVWR